MKDTINNFVQIRKKVKTSHFNPDHEFVDNAVNEFLKNGGSITQVESCSDDFHQFLYDLEDLQGQTDNIAKVHRR